MNAKADVNKENVAKQQVEKKEESKPQRKRNFTRVMESFNRLLKSNEV